MDKREQSQLVESLVRAAKDFHRSARRYRRTGFGQRLIGETKGLRDGVMIAARLVKGGDTGAYMKNLPARVARRRAAA